MGPPGRIQNCLRGIPFGWSRVAPLAEEADLRTGPQRFPLAGCGPTAG
jgi:hypothetical protein